MKKELFYIANSIYQFAYALPLYRQLGGTFVVHSPKKLRHFQAQMQGLAPVTTENPTGLPAVRLVPREEIPQLSGILFFWANTIDPDAEYGDSITLFHEHGTSDKKYEGGSPIAMAKLSKYNYIVLSGPKNAHRLVDIGLHLPASKLIEGGCFRFDDYLAGAWTKPEAQAALGIRATHRKTILYAPTWKFGNGTFRKYAGRFIRELSGEYNLILRPHYHDRRYARLLFLAYRALGYKHVYFSDPEQLQEADTYQAFVAADLLISDISSVIYEYLITQNPIVIAQNDFAERHSMPPQLSIHSVAPVYDGTAPIAALVTKSLAQADQTRASYGHLLRSCFYQTEQGAVHTGAVQRIVSFLNRLRNE